ncbi:hypothetical protein ATKI12_7366 [Kitasatospora sp. Ki12]
MPAADSGSAEAGGPVRPPPLSSGPESFARTARCGRSVGLHRR